MGVDGHCVPDELQVDTLGDAGCEQTADFSFLAKAFCFANDMASGFDFTRLCPPFFAILVWNRKSTERQNHISDCAPR
jgi:hypothetical protein